MEKYKELIDLFLKGEIDYDQFFEKITDLYIEIPLNGSTMNAEEESFLEEVYDRSTFSGKEVPKADKKYGLMDEREYRAWLLEMKQKHINFWT